MPRLTRLDAPGVLHHVMGRGDFIDRLAGVVERRKDAKIISKPLMYLQHHINNNLRNLIFSHNSLLILAPCVRYLICVNLRNLRIILIQK